MGMIKYLKGKFRRKDRDASSMEEMRVGSDVQPASLVLRSFGTMLVGVSVLTLRLIALDNLVEKCAQALNISLCCDIVGWVDIELSPTGPNRKPCNLIRKNRCAFYDISCSKWSCSGSSQVESLLSSFGKLGQSVSYCCTFKAFQAWINVE